MPNAKSRVREIVCRLAPLLPDRVRLGLFEWNIRQRVERFCGDQSENMLERIIQECGAHKDDLEDYTRCVVRVVSKELRHQT